jgi:hypothetical protein
MQQSVVTVKPEAVVTSEGGSSSGGGGGASGGSVLADMKPDIKMAGDDDDVRATVSCVPVLGFGLVWFGLVWFGLVWFGLVWFGLVWFGLVMGKDLSCSRLIVVSWCRVAAADAGPHGVHATLVAARSESRSSGRRCRCRRRL